ncbi:MAG: hypothetical protein ABI461_14365, partial [Polyangiaceae bacterium]
MTLAPDYEKKISVSKRMRAVKEDLEWVGARVPFPGIIDDGASEPFQPELTIWVGVPEGPVVAYALEGPGETARAVVAALRQAMLAPAAGPPRRPSRVRVADDAIADAIRDARLGLDVVVAPTPEIDAIVAEMRAAPHLRPANTSTSDTKG